MDKLSDKDFTPTVPPVLVREEALFGTGFFPDDAEQVYEIPKDDLYLVGTSEVPLAALHSNEILDFESLPLRYAGFSTCFRREAGTYGKDTTGIFRVHQFDKVEMFSFCNPEKSKEEHEYLLSVEEEILQELEIPYRVVDVCTGDLGASAAKKYDIEAWMPSQQNYREVTSCSNTTDFQARRLNIRTKIDGNTTTMHTLEVPELITDKGDYYDLRECADFRPFADKTAADATSPGTATIDPTSTVTFTEFAYRGSVVQL